MSKFIDTSLLILGIGILAACSSQVPNGQQVYAERRMALSEAFIDAFYSFDVERLRSFFTSAESSAADLLYYQAWAEGGNYKVVKRGACTSTGSNLIACPITVDDDPMLALNTDFQVTDTFTLTFDGDSLVKVETSSNDLPLYYEAAAWVFENRLDLVAEPCEGYFDGGPTPGACAQAMTRGYRQFMEERSAND